MLLSGWASYRFLCCWTSLACVCCSQCLASQGSLLASVPFVAVTALTTSVAHTPFSSSQTWCPYIIGATVVAGAHTPLGSRTLGVSFVHEYFLTLAIVRATNVSALP